MAAVDAVISAKNSRWESLIHLTGLLSEGKVVLEDLVSQSKSPNLVLDVGFLMKRKRSPRKHNALIKKRKPSWFFEGTSGDRSPNSILEGSPVFQTPFKKQSGAIDSNPNSACLIIPATTSDRSPDSNTPIKKRKLSWFLEGTSGDHRSPNNILLERNPVFQTPIKKQSGAIDSKPNSACLIIPTTTSDRSPNRILLERNPVFDKPFKKKQSGANSNSACLKKSNKPNPRLLVNQHIINNIQNLQPPLPEAIRGRIIETGGCLESAVVIIEKALYPTDVNPGQCRLSVPVRQVKERFLLAGEVDQLLGSEEGGNIGTTLIEPCLDERKIMFGLWKSNKMYVLKGWNDILKKYRLTAGTVIRLWAFRRNSELCFALETRLNEPIA